MTVKSMKRTRVLGAVQTLLSPKVRLHKRRLTLALLTSADLLASRQGGADSAQRPAWPMADSERRLATNRQFVSMALLAAGLMLVLRTTSAQVVTTLAGSGARYPMSEVGVSGDADGDLYVPDGGDEVN